MSDFISRGGSKKWKKLRHLPPNTCFAFGLDCHVEGLQTFASYGVKSYPFLDVRNNINNTIKVHTKCDATHLTDVRDITMRHR